MFLADREWSALAAVWVFEVSQESRARFRAERQGADVVQTINSKLDQVAHPLFRLAILP